MKVIACILFGLIASAMGACTENDPDIGKCAQTAQDAYAKDPEDKELCDIYKAGVKCVKKAGCKKGDKIFDDAEKNCNDDDAGCSKAQCKGACFAASSIVHLKNNKTKRMSELQIGDKVHVGSGVYSEVYFFSTELVDVSSKFVQISTAKASQPLLITPGHYLYVNRQLVQAREVKVGDVLTHHDGSENVVEQVSAVWAPGLYNPHTLAGDIVVDEILTSTYTEVVHPTLAHAILYPIRQLYKISGAASLGLPLSAAAKSLPDWFMKAVQSA